MATDYLLFIHGVNTRYERQQPDYANELSRLIKSSIDKSYEIKPIPLYWGYVNKESETRLLTNLKDTQGCWQQLWFQNFRETTILQFVGDAALYISRTVGSKVVESLNRQMRENGLDGEHSQDRLHLITHSWGTVILFDILFAARWNDVNIPGYKSAMEIRQRFLGVEPNPNQGIKLASIHTMGSPIALYSLLDVVPGEDLAQGKPELTQMQASRTATHDITPRLEKYLTDVGKKAQGKLPWRNYIHPADPVAFPLNPLMYSLVDGNKKYVDLQDIITKLNFFDRVMLPVSQTPISLLLGGQAHDSYLKSPEVAQEIVSTIKQSSVNV
jgi:hypothetical protein